MELKSNMNMAMDEQIYAAPAGVTERATGSIALFPHGKALDAFREKRMYNAFKRFFDFILSALAIIFLAPILLLVALLVKLDSKGPAIYVSERCGKNGKTFKMYKFRTMCQGADKKLDDLLDKNEVDGPAFKIAQDPRVTRIGHFLRKTSIDELPQLFNIFKGEMSVVGPRPPLPREVEQYDLYQRQRLDVIPGLTCYWQVSGRSNLSFDQWVDLDLKYIRERSLLTDLKIILRTVPVVLLGVGAY